MTFRKIKDIVLVLIIASCLFLPLSTKLANKLGVAFPEWTGVGNHQSQLEGRNYIAFPKVKVRAIAKGNFQTKVEKYLSDAVPMRENILIANAALQHVCIKAANVPFGFECIPTFFGSNFSVEDKRMVVSRTVRGPTEDTREAVAVLVDLVNQAKELTPDGHVLLEIVIDKYISEFNPTYPLVSNVYDDAWMDQHITQELTDGVELIFDKIKFTSEYYDDWFSTDHHWTPKRAHQSYQLLGNALGWVDVPYGNEQLVIPKWWGYSSRGGLFLNYSDELRDAPHDYSFLRCTVNGEEQDRGLLEPFWRGETVSFDPFRGYVSYYGESAAVVTYENLAAPNEKTCLLIMQSYGKAIERDIARNYRKTICINPLNCEVHQNLTSLIDLYHPDDILFQFGIVDLPAGLIKSPELFGR